MRRLPGFFALAALSVVALAKDAPPPPDAPVEAVEDRVTVERLDAATSAHATVAGTLVAVAAARRAGGSRELVLLVAPPESKKTGDAAASSPPPCNAPPAADERAGSAPRRLVRFDPSGAGSLTTLREDLAADTHDLVPADLDGDGVDELLLVRAGSVAALRDDGDRRFAAAPTVIVETADEAIGALLPGSIGTGVGKPALVSIAVLGSLRTYGAGDDGAVRLLSEVPLPLKAERETHGLELSTQPVRKLDVGGQGDLVVVDPEPRGSERLRSIVIRPGAPEAERRQEAWSRLPAAEKVLESSFLLLDGRPALAVTTMPAGKLSFFGEKLLRVFFLESDRTRAGKAPVAALQTNANLWQSAHVHATDVNGDSRQDLVVAYWKGLKDDTVMLDAYLRREDGTFERSPRSTSFDVEQADRGVLVYRDSDGAGLADLVLVAAGKLAFYAGGDRDSGGRRLVQAKPSWTVPLPTAVKSDRSVSISIGADDADIREGEASGLVPVLVDLDGDGRMEIIVAGGGGVPGHLLAVLPSR